MIKRKEIFIRGKIVFLLSVYKDDKTSPYFNEN